MARLLRLAGDELRMLHRSTWWWILAAFAPTVLLLRVQEPSFFRRADVPLFWSGVQALVVMVVGLLPLAWALNRGDPAGAWRLRTILRPAAIVAFEAGGVFLYGVLAAGVLVATSAVVDVSFGGRMPAQVLLDGSLGAALFLVPLAALAPALHHAQLGTAGTAGVWMLVLGASAGLFGKGFLLPADTVLPALQPSAHAAWLDPLAVAALSAVGGFALSLAIVRSRLSP